MAGLLLPPAAAFYASLKGPPMNTMTPVELRQFFKDDPGYGPLPKEQLGKIYDMEAEGPGGAIPLRVYEPKRKGPFPIIIYLHGGGWMLGDNSSHETAAAYLALKCDAVTVAVEYRLAPEHPFPAAVDDCWAALEWVKENAKSINGLADKIATCGESAGGTLSVVMTLMAKEKGVSGLVAQVPVCMAADMASMETPSYKEFEFDILESKKDIEWFRDHYLQGQDPKDPRASVKYAKDLSGLPPTFVITAEVDVLRDEAEEFAELLEGAGVETVVKRYKGHFHNSMFDVGMFGDEAIKCYEEIAAFLAKPFGRE